MISASACQYVPWRTLIFQNSRGARAGTVKFGIGFGDDVVHHHQLARPAEDGDIAVDGRETAPRRIRGAESARLMRHISASDRWPLAEAAGTVGTSDRSMPHFASGRRRLGSLGGIHEERVAVVAIERTSARSSARACLP